jgi:hypothetical protein
LIDEVFNVVAIKLLFFCKRYLNPSLFMEFGVGGGGGCSCGRETSRDKETSLPLAVR